MILSLVLEVLVGLSWEELEESAAVEEEALASSSGWGLKVSEEVVLLTIKGSWHSYSPPSAVGQWRRFLEGYDDEDDDEEEVSRQSATSSY